MSLSNLTDRREVSKSPPGIDCRNVRPESEKAWRPRQFSLCPRAFLVGGVALGIVGAIIGASMPYRRPVAVTISVLWWANYCGWLGASIGALFGLWTKRSANSPSRQTDLGQSAGAACESVGKRIPRAVVTGPAAARAASKIASSRLISSSSRYLPLPNDQDPTSNWEDQIVY
jgi:hypothetical protein